MSSNPNPFPGPFPGQSAHTVPILIAMFEPSIEHLLSGLLSLEGYETVVARDGEDALRWLVPATRAHLVMVDAWFSAKFGDEFNDYLTDPVRRAPHRLIALTVLGNVAAIRARDQPDGMLLLPFTVDDVLTEVGRMERVMCEQADPPLGFIIDM